MLSKADLHLLLLLALLQSIFVSYHRISRLTVFKFFGLALLACYTSFLYLPPLDFLSGSPSFVHDEILAKRIDCRLANNLHPCILYMCVLSSHFLDIRLVDATAGVTQEEGHRISPPSLCGACLNFFSWEGFSRPFPSSTVMSKSVHPRINRSPLVGHEFCFIY